MPTPQRSSRWLRIALLFLALFLTSAAAAAVFGLRQLEPVTTERGGERAVTIPRGATTAEIAALLAWEGLIRNPLAFRLAALYRDADGRMQAGRYRFGPYESPFQIIDRLVRGDVIRYTVTIPEGLRVEEVIERLAEAGVADRTSLRAAVRNRALVADFVPSDLELPEPLEGYLFPDTYVFTDQTSAAELIAAMVDRFRTVWETGLRAAATREGLTAHQLVTLASLVEEEARMPEERPVIAAVYRNRLRLGMKLDSDPTVRYALGKWEGLLLYRDLEVDSPYNTYRSPGLPPGPVSAPGLAALRAVLDPASVPYLYFVSCDGRTHRFAVDLETHNRNVASCR